MAIQAGTVYLPIRPRLTGFGAEVRKAATSAATGAGQQAGRQMATGMTTAVNGASGRLASSTSRTLGAAGTAGAGALTSSMRRGLTRAGNLFTPALQAVGRFRDGFTNAGAAASAFSGRMGTAGGIARRAIDSLHPGAARLGAAFESAAQRGSGALLGTLGSAITRVKSMVMGSAGFLGIAGLAGLVKMGIDRISSIEQARASLQTMMGDTVKAKALLDQVLNWAKGKPFSFPELATASKKLIGFGMAAHDVVPTLEMIGTVSLNAGKGSAGFEQITAAIGTMQTMGTVSMGEIRRLEDAGVPALKILANQAGISAAEMQQRISSGAMNSTDAIRGLVAGVRDGTKGIAGETPKMGGLLQSMGDTWVGTMDKLRSSMARAAANVLEPMMPAIKSAVVGIGSALEGLSKTGALKSLVGVFGGLVSIIRGAMPAVAGFASVFAVVFAPALAVLRPLGSALNVVGQWMQRHQAVVGALGAAIGAVVVAMNAWRVVMVVIRVVTLAWAAAQAILNAVMYANPIGLIVLAIIGLVAAFVFLWHKSAAFRDFWITIWTGIKTAALWVWENALRPAFAGIAAAAAWCAERVRFGIALITFVFQRVAADVSAVWGWLWSNVVGPAIDGVRLTIAAVQYGWSLLTQVFQWFQIGAAAAWNMLWQGVIAPVVAWVNTYVVGGVRAGWQMLVSAFDWLRATASAAWSLLWAGVGAAIGWVQANVVAPVGAALQRVVGFFVNVRDQASAIWSSLWNGIKETAKQPVNFVIGTVYNSGIRRVWNAIAGLIGKGQLGEVALLAHGGVLPGYAPGRDRVPALLSPGEGVLRPEVVRWLGAGTIHALNAAARGGALGFADGGIVPASGMLRFADGGVVGNILGSAFDWLTDGLETLVRKALSPVRAAVQGLGPGQWGNAIAVMAQQAIDAIIAMVKKFEETFTGGKFGAHGSWNSKQVTHVGTIVAAAKRARLSNQAAVIATATAMQESMLKNYANSSVPSSLSYPHEAVGSDHDSVGLFQQRPSPPEGAGSWGTVKELMTPIISAGKFYNALKGVGGWSSMPLSVAAQTVQVSAFPDAYAKWENDAKKLVAFVLSSAGKFADGGIVPRLYDSGGALPPGWTLAFNGTGHDELVTDPRRHTAERAAGGVTVHLHGAKQNSREQAAAIGRTIAWQMRSAVL